MRLLTRLLILLVASSALVACGGNGSGNMGAAPPATPQRGALLTDPPAKLGSYSGADLLTLLGGNDLGKELLQLAIAPTCSVDAYQLKYETVGGIGEATSASGALMVPSGPDAACQGARPVVLYAHGTSTDRNYNIADLSNSSNGEGLLLAALFASQGYIVVAPNYAGYDTSTLAYHPYLDAEQQSNDMIDALTAARSALPALAMPVVSDGGKLFITGYSQGGYVAMATHRAMQAAGMTVTASAPMSGPYALAAFGDAIFEGEVAGGSTINMALLVSSYQHVYGNIYNNATDMFEAAYAPGIASLLPSTISRSDLYAQGKLPQFALFSSTPPDASFASFTPATIPADLAPVFALGFGAGNLITNSYRLSYLQDAAANPDGGFPATTTGIPAANPANTLRQALKLNDLRNWTPSAPLLLCAGNADPTVLYLNTQLMQRYWAANAPGAAVTVLDVDSPAGSGDPYGGLKNQFAVAKDLIAATAVAGGATDGGAAAVFEAYHAQLVPPFCLSAVKSFFDTH